jgi:hypothetical protein
MAAAVIGKNTIHPTTSGTTMRVARSRMKARTPRRWNTIRAKNPARTKNSVIRNT